MKINHKNEILLDNATLLSIINDTNTDGFFMINTEEHAGDFTVLNYVDTVMNQKRQCVFCTGTKSNNLTIMTDVCVWNCGEELE